MQALAWSARGAHCTIRLRLVTRLHPCAAPVQPQTFLCLDAALWKKYGLCRALYMHALRAHVAKLGRAPRRGWWYRTGLRRYSVIPRDSGLQVLAPVAGVRQCSTDCLRRMRRDHSTHHHLHFHCMICQDVDRLQTLQCIDTKEHLNTKQVSAMQTPPFLSSVGDHSTRLVYRKPTDKQG